MIQVVIGIEVADIVERFLASILFAPWARDNLVPLWQGLGVRSGQV